MPPRIILMTGAPPPSAVEEETCTIQSFSNLFQAFVDAKGDNNGGYNEDGEAGTIAPWRSVSLHREPLHTGFSQAHSFLNRFYLHESHNDEEFFCTSSLKSSYDGPDEPEKGDADELNEFYQQSLALHNSIPSSQLGDEHITATTLLDETSFLSNSTTASAGPAPPPPNIPPAHLSDLEDVPPAKQVISLQPQTVTLNLIVGILSVAQPRSVTTRWGQRLSLVEILVGDETRAGFAVTFWLSNDATEAASDLNSLRRQDVVLLQNVALHVFRDKVYGQSLRRGQTKVHLLWSKRPDARPCYSSRKLVTEGADEQENPQVVKTRLVRDWVLRFVGVDPAAKGKSEQHVWDHPPEDTQE